MVIMDLGGIWVAVDGGDGSRESVESEATASGSSPNPY